MRTSGANKMMCKFRSEKALKNPQVEQIQSERIVKNPS
jgi:hypothetical protein